MQLCREAWALAHPHRVRAIRRNYMARRKALMRGAGATERIDPIVVWERDGGICHICGDSVSFYRMHVDHFVPLSRGGAHSYDNVRAAHADCNVWKNARLMEDLDAR
jgi:5-methylcytosine-specific restriction endonuclease McrA